MTTEDFLQFDVNDTQTVDSFVQVTTATMEPKDILTCPKRTFPCNDTMGFGDESYCLNGGLCCYSNLNNESLCRCLQKFTGKRCEEKHFDADDLLAAFESRENLLAKAGMSSLISLTIGLLALVAFLVLVALVIRKRMLQQHPKECLERHLSEIQDELDRLPTIHKLIHLTRLTRIFEASTVATAKATVLYETAPGADSKAREERYRALNQSSMSQCLPRWSSAPAILNTTAMQVHDETDNAITSIDRRKLHQVLSYDETRRLQDTRL